MAAFALSRYTFRGREAPVPAVRGRAAVPLNAASLPLYLLLDKIGLLDNLFGVALPEAAFSLPITIVILRPFMRAIPGELEDAAVVDGASRLRFFLRILLPLSRPALVTVAMLAFVTSWNAYLLPLLRVHQPAHYTLPLGGGQLPDQVLPGHRAASSRSPRCRWCRRWPSSSSPSGISSAASPARSRADQRQGGAPPNWTEERGERGTSDPSDEGRRRVQRPRRRKANTVRRKSRPVRPMAR